VARQQTKDSIDDQVRFQQAVIVAARNVIDTFDRKLLDLRQRRLDLEKEERDLKRSFADAPDSIERAKREVARLQTLQGRANGVSGMVGRRAKTDVERKLARRSAILAQLAAINDELGLKGEDEPS